MWIAKPSNVQLAKGRRSTAASFDILCNPTLSVAILIVVCISDIYLYLLFCVCMHNLLLFAGVGVLRKLFTESIIQSI